MRHASLFSGIGGFDLAARWMGWENVMQCEIDPFCQQVLRHHFPSTTLYGDIRTIDGNAWNGKIDILTGGFPCQPFSTAGQRRGTGDDRFLWPEMLRVIREVQPSWIVAENVRGITSQDGGVVFERVRSEVEALGYECQPLLIPACAVGAPHRRDRVWFVAHAQDDDGGGNARELSSKNEQRREEGSEGRIAESCSADWREHWLEAATRLCRVDDGLPRELDGISFPKWRKESLKSYGNAIVPQVAFRIFQAITSSLPA